MSRRHKGNTMVSVMLFVFFLMIGCNESEDSQQSNDAGEDCFPGTLGCPCKGQETCEGALICNDDGLCIERSIVDDGEDNVPLQDGDVEDSEEPITACGLVPQGGFSGRAEDVQVVGDIAYVLLGNGGLLTFNVSNPSDPQWIGSYQGGGTSYGMAIRGNRAYLAVRTRGLVIVDISDPSNLRLISECHCVDCLPLSVTVYEPYVYVVDRFNGLEIYNIEDETNPDLQIRGWGTLDCYSLLINDHFAYMGTSDGFNVYDLSDAPAMHLIWTDSQHGSPSDFLVDSRKDDRLYLAYKTGLVALDISDPSNPVEVEDAFESKNAGQKGTFDSPQLVQDGDRLFVFSSDGVTTEYLLSDSVERAPQITLRGEEYRLPSGAMVENTLLVAGDWLFSVDVESGEIVGKAMLPTQTYGVSMVGNVGYVSCLGGAIAFDFSDPTQPRYLSSLPFAETRNVAQLGDMALLAGSFGQGLALYDVSDIRNPRKVQEVLDMSHYSNQLLAAAISDSFLVYSDNHLLTYTLDDDNHLVYQATWPISDNFYVDRISDYRIDENRLAFMADSGRIVLVELNKRKEPVITNEWKINPDPESYVYGFDVHEDILVLSTHYWIFIYRIVDDALEPLSRFQLKKAGRDVAFDGHFAYVGDTEATMTLVDLSDPEHPQRVGIYNQGGSTDQVTALGDDTVLFSTLWHGGYISRITWCQ